MITIRTVLTFDNTELYLKTDIPTNPKAVAVIVHGLCEHQGRYDYLTSRLYAQGIAVYRFDHRGHGQSKGDRVFYSDYNEIVDDVNEIVKLAETELSDLPLFIIGHSMGGYATALFATKYPGRAKGIILSGALTRYNLQTFGTIPEELSDTDYIDNSLASGVCSDPSVGQAYTEDPFVEKQISIGLMRSLLGGLNYLKTNAADFVEPALIMHGANDGLVSEKDSRDLFGEIGSKDKELVIYANLMHEIFNEFEKDRVINNVLRWIKKHI